jgi:hypothetical protein
MIEQPDGRFAVIAGDRGEFIQDAALVWASGMSIPLPDRRHVFAFGPCTHERCSHERATVTLSMARRSPRGNSLDGAIRFLDFAKPGELRCSGLHGILTAPRR